MSIYLFNETQFSYIMRIINLTKSELRKIFSVKTEFALTEKTTLKTRALLQSTSIIYNFVDPKHIAAKIIAKLFITPSFPEHEKEPYWIIKKTGHIDKCHECGKDLDEYWYSKANAYYYHVI